MHIVCQQRFSHKVNKKLRTNHLISWSFFIIIWSFSYCVHWHWRFQLHLLEDVMIESESNAVKKASLISENNQCKCLTDFIWLCCSEEIAKSDWLELVDKTINELVDNVIENKENFSDDVTIWTAQFLWWWVLVIANVVDWW